MRFFRTVWAVIFLLFFYKYSQAQEVKSIGATKHNLSISGSFSINSEITSEICVFCHTPNSSNPHAPGWNRKETGQVYQTFESSSSEYVTSLVKPDGSSKLCLSCHDGSIALDDVLNLPGFASTGSLQLTNSVKGKLTVSENPDSSQTNYSSYPGLNLTNDHPISFRYDDTLAYSDGELRDPGELLLMNPLLPLDKNNKLQCTTCHDPHIAVYPKFLRVPKRQTDVNAYEGVGSMICLYCHIKKDTGLLFNWIGSTHQASEKTYDTEQNGNYLVKLGKEPGMALWEDGCLMCHDTHTVYGGKRLLLEGTDNSSRPRDGGNPASEETCYLCHTNQSETVLDDSTNPSKDIKSEFTSTTYHMPIKTIDQAYLMSEVHDVQNADLEEIGTGSYTMNQGVPNLGKKFRHVECSDCHNPHRIISNRQYNGTGVAGIGTHEHNVDSTPHTNIASGSLLGSWGIDPDYTRANWSNWPENIVYNKKGISGGTGLLNAEYQLCLKCHSSFAFGDTEIPVPGNTGGNTPNGTNDFLTSYTDQAKEFNPANAGFHPVMANTGRNLATRTITASPFLAPWNGKDGKYVGSQTMYCSDCHGKNADGEGNSDPTPKGPHGSNNSFLLIGKWDFNTGTVSATAGIEGDLCFKCHDSAVYSYASQTKDGTYTGFKGNAGVNLHSKHMSSVHQDDWEIRNGFQGIVNSYKITCMTCHDAVMHGVGGLQPNKGRNLLTAFKSVGSACTPSSSEDHELCIDQTASDEKPYRTSRSRLRVEDRDIATSGWGNSGTWVKENCNVAHNGNGIISGCLPSGVQLP